MMIIDYPWYLVPLCLLAGAAYAAVLYFIGRHSFGRKTRILLASLRFVAVSLLAFLLFAPMVKQTVHERQKPVVVLVHDVSGSVRSSADADFSIAMLRDELGDMFEIVTDTFGTDLHTDLASVLETHRYDNTAALVMASDGIHNRGANPATTAERLTFPVHTIMLGDTTPRRDAAIADLRCNRIAMLGNTFPVEMTVNATLLKGRSATLTVNGPGGKRLYSQPIQYDDDNYSVTLNATLPAEKAGLTAFTVTLGTADGEATAENNRLTFYVDIIDTKRKVAIIANAPHPDVSALKQAIEGNPGYEVRVMLADEAGKSRWKADGYSMAILHNLPSKQHPAVDYMSDMPQMFVIGMQTDLARFNALHTGLEILSRAAKANEVTALYQEGFPLFNLDGGDAITIEALPPLSAPFGEAKTAIGVQTLFTARLGNIDTRQPLIAAVAEQKPGDVRRSFVWGEGLWRWRLGDYQTNMSHDAFDRLVSQLVSFTAMQHSRNRLQVEAERSYSDDETPIIRAQLYNENFELTNTPEVKLSLRGDSLNGDYTFLRDGAAYRLSLPDLKAGVYHYKATAENGLTDEGTFAVERIDLERRNLTANHLLLRTISQTTGGVACRPDNLEPLKEALSAMKPSIHTHMRYSDFLRLPLVMLLLIVLLGAEWVIRKYHGEL